MWQPSFWILFLQRRASGEERLWLTPNNDGLCSGRWGFRPYLERTEHLLLGLVRGSLWRCLRTSRSATKPGARSWLTSFGEASPKQTLETPSGRHCTDCGRRWATTFFRPIETRSFWFLRQFLRPIVIDCWSPWTETMWRRPQSYTAATSSTASMSAKRCSTVGRPPSGFGYAHAFKLPYRRAPKQHWPTVDGSKRCNWSSDSRSSRPLRNPPPCWRRMSWSPPGEDRRRWPRCGGSRRCSVISWMCSPRHESRISSLA